MPVSYSCHCKLCSHSQSLYSVGRCNRVTKTKGKNLKAFAQAVSNPSKVNLKFRFQQNGTGEDIKESSLIDNWLALMEHLLNEIYASSARLYPMANELKDTYSSMTTAMARHWGPPWPPCWMCRHN